MAVGGGRKGVCVLDVGCSYLALPFCSWANLNMLTNLSELQCALLQSRHNYSYLQGWRWNSMMLVMAVSVRVQFLQILHTPFTFCLTGGDVGPRKACLLHGRNPRPRSSGEGQGEERGKRTASSLPYHSLPACLLLNEENSLQGFYEDWVRSFWGESSTNGT